MTKLGHATDNEHDFDGEFGPCLGCGKYVEQLMEERYCLMEKIAQQTQPKTKYPNADTSPERLAEIELDMEKGVPIIWYHVRDLLAMLQVRDFTLAQLLEAFEAKSMACELYRQQLHDQRWRRVVDDEPPRRDIVEFSWMDEGQQVTALGLWGHPMLMRELPQPLSIPQIWWCPIPPLPKE